MGAPPGVVLPNSAYPPASANRSMFKPGVYKILNNASGTVVDLSQGDHRSIIDPYVSLTGFPLHGGCNQQWEFSRLGDGYAIRNVLEGLYLTIVDGLHKGVRIVGNPHPVSWVVEVHESRNGAIQISWPERDLVLEVENYGNATPGTPVQLWERFSNTPSFQLWTLFPCEKKKVVGSAADTASTTDTVIDEDENGGYTITTTTTTTTVTKVSRMIPLGKAAVAEQEA